MPGAQADDLERASWRATQPTLTAFLAIKTSACAAVGDGEPNFLAWITALEAIPLPAHAGGALRWALLKIRNDLAVEIMDAALARADAAPRLAS